MEQRRIGRRKLMLRARLRGLRPRASGALWLTLLIAGPASAEWTFVDTWSDPIDGYETKVARHVNADGFGLHLYRSPVGRVMALYTLPEDAGAFPVEGPVAVVTPDGFKPKEIVAQTEQGRIVEYARSTGRALRDRLWHGEGQVPVGTLADILDAPAIGLTVTLATGETVDTRWPMQGAKLPIAQALGLNIEGIPAGAAWEDAASQAMLAAMTACQFPKLDMACVQQVTACSPQISDARDIDGFEACLAEGQ
ncbi:MAG: hypothetical protein AAFQ59_03400 [Pseudomonadota bacterium]